MSEQYRGDMTQQRILIISVSAGSGHVRAADALLETARQQFPDVIAEHIDVMNYVGSGFKRIYTDFYRQLIHYAPVLWSYLYQKTDQAQRSDVSSLLRRAIEQLCTKKMIRKIHEFNPDHIICTHFLPAELLSREIHQKRLHCPVWVQVTDFDLHSLWVQPHMRGYFAATQEVAFKIRERGVAAEAIAVTGIPLMPVFSGSAVHIDSNAGGNAGSNPDKQASCAQLGLQARLPTVLLMSGGARFAHVTELAKCVLRISDAVQVIAMAGHHQQRFEELTALAAQYPGRVLPLRFSHNMETLMAASDLIVTKPGGLTSSECLAQGLPMVLVDPIPGQEERNGDYLMEKGVAVKARDMAALEYKIRHYLINPHQLNEVRHRMLTLARPDAALAVLIRVLGVISEKN